MNTFLLLILLICVITDIRNRKIYNKVIYPALLVTFTVQFVAGGWEGLSHSFIGFLIGFSLLLIPYFMGGMGAGDVKLLAFIGALKGGSFVFQSFLYIAIIGAIMAGFILIFRRGTLKSIGYSLLSLRSGARIGEVVPAKPLTATYPYGVAIALGALAGIAAERNMFLW